jgi:LDH2 family malate/lactate/ureidoglycolate dehydrogenase
MSEPTSPALSDPEVLVDVLKLRALTRDCFKEIGIPAVDAEAVADVLMDANLRAMESHGFQRVPIYMKRVLAGLAGGTENLTVLHQEGVFCRMDAGHALGPAAAVKALQKAIGLSRQHGLGVVAVRNSTHFGAAGYYARQAAEAGQASIVLSNAVKRMAPHGALEPFVGTNPLAVGVPLAHHPSFVLDMSSSVTAQGKITRARDLGLPLPEGVALDADGWPTTDPVAALAGSLLPVGGPKGSGLALAISMLCVLLAGAECDDQMGSLYNDFDRPQNTGHIFITIDVARLQSPGGQDQVDQMMDRLAVLRRPDAAPAPKYPGQETASFVEERRQSGIPIRRGELLRVAEVCRDANLFHLASRARELVPDGAAAT